MAEPESVQENEMDVNRLPGPKTRNSPDIVGSVW
jgi:hypothetical protein